MSRHSTPQKPGTRMSLRRLLGTAGAGVAGVGVDVASRAVGVDVLVGIEDAIAVGVGEKVDGLVANGVAVVGRGVGERVDVGVPVGVCGGASAVSLGGYEFGIE